MSNDRLQRALEELHREQRQVERLREDYRTIARSRFYALRMLWLSVKAMIGRPGDHLAAGVAEDPRPEPATAPKSPSRDEVISLWRSRTSAALSDAPSVSVVIPVFNHVDDTLRCLHSIAAVWPATLRLEVIVVDDGSTDGSPAALPQVPGVVYIRNSQNLGFIGACNAGARRATGRYVCFLNNDTVVRNGWIEALVSTAEHAENVGAVGAKLLYPNGFLQEAGGIIWRDGTGWNYGRNGDSKDARYNYERDVDYCSGAALLVRRDLFDMLGGFSETYTPAYYEDADLCFAIREAGFRVVYQPRAEVVHFEGVTSGTELTHGVKRYQQLNQPKFAKKWRRQLQRHLPNEHKNVALAARRLSARPRILIVDSYVPLHDKEAGSNRLMHIIRILRDGGYGVVFLPDNYAALQPYTAQLEEIGVEVLYHSDGGRPIEAALEEALQTVDYVWICRPELFSKYAPTVRRTSPAALIYDTIDLHFVRKRREFEVLGRGADESSQYEEIELSAARNADATLVVSQPEREVLVDRGIANVHVVPTIHNKAVECARVFDDSTGVIFIGNYNHSPNVDAVEWLVAEIMPLVWKNRPDVTLTLLGSNPTRSVRSLASKRIHVPGYVENVAPYFLNARVFVAPMRFGAGLKGKVGHALSFGLPAVVTDIAAEGFGLSHNLNCIIANDAEEIAAGIQRLYEDRALWSRISGEELRALEPFGDPAVQRCLSDLFGSLRGAERCAGA